MIVVVMTKDYEPNHTILATIVKGGVKPDVWECLKNQGNKINQMGATYYLYGPNSNSVVKYLLEKCNLPMISPNVEKYTGWDKPIK